MGFFFNEQKAEKPKRSAAPAKAKLQDIPVRLLREMSCSVCPRDKDTSIRAPKMRPEGPRDAPVYLLAGSPSREDDEDDVHWVDAAMSDIYSKFGKAFMSANVRSNYTVQCFGEENVAVTECCRGRIESDIEEVKPLLIVTVGDAALRWATGVSSNAPHNRGQLFVARFGKHVCHVLPIVYPNYVHKKMGRSNYELAVKTDVEWVKDNYDRLPEPHVYGAPFDTNIQRLTGEQPGDIHVLAKRLVEISKYPESALDIETNGLRPYMLRNPAILTAAVGTFEDTLAFPLDFPDDLGGWGTSGRRQRAMETFAEFLQYSGAKTCHNLGFEQEWIGQQFGLEVLRRTEWDDTMAMAHVLDSSPGTKSLDAQTIRNFGFSLKSQSPVDVKVPEWWRLWPLTEILRYNGMDTKWTDNLRRMLAARIDGEPRQRDVYEHFLRLVPTLIWTQAPGLPVDFDYARKLESEMLDALEVAETKLARCDEIRKYERTTGRFSPTNPDQVLALMKGLGRDEVKREDHRTGAVTWTTDEEALSAIPVSEVPSAKIILEHREISKLLGTYIKPALAKKWVGPDGRVHSSYASMVAVTNRLSSEDPNVQNFPKRKHKKVRGMIYAGRGRWLVPCDYGQIEFRVVGMASGDENLVKYCWTGYDVHKFWAERAVKEYPRIKDWIVSEFEVDWDEVGLKTLRQEMKNKWVFPQLFGSTTESCARNLHLPDDVASHLGEEFWDEFSGVKKWQRQQVKFYEKHLYVETLGGFKRRGAMSVNELINLPIQGTAAEIVKEAHMALSERADSDGDMELQPVLNVHDDLTFNIADENMERKIDIITREMCLPRFSYINVPLVVEVSVGARWSEAEELKKFWSHELFGTHNPYA